MERAVPDGLKNPQTTDRTGWIKENVFTDQ